MERKICFVVFCALLFAAGAANAADSSFSGTVWVGHDEKGVARLMEFRKDGAFVDMSNQVIHTGAWKEKNGHVRGVAKYNEIVDKGRVLWGEHSVYVARIENGKLLGTMAFSYDGVKTSGSEYGFELQRDTSCPEEPGLCNGKLYCIDHASRTSLTAFTFLRDGAASEKEGVEKFSDFLAEFGCAARLNLAADLQHRVRFPLVVSKVEDAEQVGRYEQATKSRSSRRVVDKADFATMQLWPRERQKFPLSWLGKEFPSAPVREGQTEQFTFVPPFTPAPGMTAQRFGGEGYISYWHFSEIKGAWHLDGIWECEGTVCPEAIFCGEAYTKSKFSGAVNKKEDFYEFFHVFYCALRADKKELVLSRTQSPLSYEIEYLYDEGGVTGSYKKGQVMPSSLINDSDAPPKLFVRGDSAEAKLDKLLLGKASELQFKRIQNKWHLVHAKLYTVKKD